MAEQGFLQRGLTSVRSTMRSVGGAVQKAAAGAAKKVKSSAGPGVEKTAGHTQTDAYNDDDEEQRRKQKARRFFGDDEPSFVGVRTEAKRDLSTVAPEFRSQVQAGLSSANTMTTGSVSGDD